MASKKIKKKPKFQTFQETIINLQKFWSKNGCVILQPYDMEVGAGTFHPATTLRSLGPKPWKAAYVQPSRRPTDGRYGDNPNRLQHYYQFQVIIKPSPINIKKLYLNSLSVIGINHKEHDIRFVEDDWESPTLGAAGLGWEVWCDGKIFDMHESEAKSLVEKNISLPAYDQCLKASHIFNVLDARGAISVAQRAEYIGRIREITKQAATIWVQSQT